MLSDGAVGAWCLEAQPRAGGRSGASAPVRPGFFYYLFLRISAAPWGIPSLGMGAKMHPHILMGAGSWQQPWPSAIHVGQLRRCPAWGQVRARGGGSRFPTRAWGARGAGTQPRSCVPLGPVPAPCPPFPLPFSYFIYFSDVGNEVMKSAPSKPGFNTAPCLGPGCFTSGAANPSLSSCQP